MRQAFRMSELTATSQARHAARALSCLDLTSLNLDDTPQRIDALCDRALMPAPGIELHPAAVCIYPAFVSQVRARLAGTGIAVAAVANFPLGTSPVGRGRRRGRAGLGRRRRRDRCRLSVPRLPGRRSPCCRRPRAPHRHRVSPRRPSGGLADQAEGHTGDRRPARHRRDQSSGRRGRRQRRRLLEDLDRQARTGRHPAGRRGAAGGDRRTHAATDNSIGLKVAGGVKTVDEAAIYLELADRYLHPDTADPGNFRFGASGLLNDIVRVLGSSHDTQMSTEY